jgi:uncharacterized cupin superfamily protein
MDQILVESNPAPIKLEVMGVDDWPLWEKGVSEFPWSYDQTETCYLLAGEAIVTPVGGAPQTIREGDLVTFMKGLSCTWKIVKPVRKHYKFG